MVHTAVEGEEEITSFQPHQADYTTYKQESVELVCLTLGTMVGETGNAGG
jgi:hypothetical protein